MRTLLDIIEIFSTVTFVTGLLSNLLLLYIIRRFSTKELGTYKYLLAIFAAYDAYLVVAHHITNPKTIPSPTGFAFVADRDFGVFELPVFYACTYAVPIALLNIHLLYRYWIITAPHKIELFSQRRFQALLIGSALFSQIILFVFVCITGRPEEEAELRNYQILFREVYERDTNDGVLIFNYWRDGKLNIRPLLLLVFGDIVEFSSLCVAAALAIFTYRAIKEARHISETMRTFHLRILIAASVQTLTPVIFVYTPLFLNINISLVHIYSPTFSALAMVFFPCFPCIDAVVIIVFIKPYWNGFLKLLGRKEETAVKILGSAFSTSVDLSKQ